MSGTKSETLIENIISGYLNYFEVASFIVTKCASFIFL